MRNQGSTYHVYGNASSIFCKARTICDLHPRGRSVFDRIHHRRNITPEKNKNILNNLKNAVKLKTFSSLNSTTASRLAPWQGQ